MESTDMQKWPQGRSRTAIRRSISGRALLRDCGEMASTARGGAAVAPAGGEPGGQGLPGLASAGLGAGTLAALGVRWDGAVEYTLGPCVKLSFSRRGSQLIEGA